MADRTTDAQTGATQADVRVVAIASRALTRASDLGEGAAEAIEAILDRLGATAAALYLTTDDVDDLELLVAIGASNELAPALARLAVADDDPLAEAARDRRSVAADGSGRVAQALAAGAIRAEPLLVTRDAEEGLVGVLGIGWPSAGAVDPAADSLLPLVGDLLALAVDRARLLAVMTERGDWADRVSHTDALTGLANRRVIDRVLELEVARAARHGAEVSVAVFDVDGLTAVNEARGRRTGDDVLRRVAAALAESVRLVDTVGRYGGDEFVVLAPGAGGMVVAQRVVDAVRALDVTGADRVSVSAGVARFPADGAGAAELIAAAQGALERARASGPGGIAGTPPA